MSLPRKETIQCPDCGEKFEVTLWESINTGIPTALQDIISGELFHVVCPKCGTSNQLIYPMLFNDMEHGVMIWLAPGPEAVMSVLPVVSSMPKLQKLRIVQSSEQLSEKVCIFRDGLDDRIVEICKLAVLSINAELPIQGITYHSSENSDLFDILLDGGVKTVGGSAELYSFMSNSPEILADLDRFSQDEYIIDLIWAQKVAAHLLKESGESET